jgi:hypothetical protein
VVCFAKGYSSPSNSATAAITSGERQGVSPPCRCSVADDTFQPQFTSLTPRYVTKRIADLEVGEEVVAKDPESGEVTTKRVANVFRKVSDHLRILQVRNPLTNELQTIETTDDHPFWVAALGQWIDAKDLKLGDRLDDVDGGTAILESTSRDLHPEGIPVFNFEVEDFHTYFVRAHGSRGPPVLTHNTECNEFLSTFDVVSPGIDGLPGTGVFGDLGRFEIALGFREMYEINGSFSHVPIRTRELSRGRGPTTVPPLKSPVLENFGRDVGARPYMQWPDHVHPDKVGMKRGVLGAAREANQIHFNLAGFSSDIKVRRQQIYNGLLEHGRHTENELGWILSRPELRRKTTFYRNGQALSNPNEFFGVYWDGLRQ